MTAPIVQLGKNYRLQVGVGATPVFTNILGEQSGSLKGAPDKIDVSSKDDGDYKTNAYGQQDITVTLSGVTKLPDPALAALETARKALGSAVPIQIVNNTAGADPVTVFAAAMAVGSFSFDSTNKDAVKYSFELSLAAAPTTDSFFGG